MPLTAAPFQDYALPVALIGGNGFGDLCNSDARAMRRKSCGFFYALRFMAGGVLGGRKACRLQSPVRQPDTSSAALSLATPVGGIKSNTTLESAMKTQSQVTPIVRVDNTDIPVIVHQENRVITTELLAQVYGTEITNIQQNFNNNQDRFEEGKHYFKLEGEALREFKSLTRNNLVSRQTRNLILWTERGAARHAKMLDTDQAWDVFDKLEAAYFEPNDLVTKPISSPEPALAHQNSVTLHLGENSKPKRYLVTQGESDLTVIRALPDDTFVGTGEQAARDLRADGYIVAKKDSVSVQRMVMDYIPAELLPDMIEAAAQQLKVIDTSRLTA